MNIALFMNLLLAHLVGDFVLQTGKTCTDKQEKHWRSPFHYIHAAIVFGLSWLASLDVNFIWYALVIGLTHFAIDMWKTYHGENVKWFVLDQTMHVLVLLGIVFVWTRSHCFWSGTAVLTCWYVPVAVAALICWKPANIFIKLVLKHYSVNMPEDKENGFNVGALIGTIERWLILIFVCLQRYEALGLLIAAKSIIRFGDKETAKTEYVLAGTLLSILIAVLAGMMVIGVLKP